ncbi:hypothetical protein J2S28_005396 [Rhizobium sp. SLBN-94]|nr:hypothetical protein [Rhizobium sp. SLBN-94]
MAYLPRRRFHHDGGRVHIADLSDFTVDQSRTDCMDFHKLLSEKETGHVEVVNYHIAENSA